ncbi:retinol dehydrogenase 12 [Microdochium nivale]|nr:retinol dehydrogenase 12 [Microdochium nivale]
MARVWSDYLKSQLCTPIPVPTHSFATQTVMVTGANTGMGLEAARHFARLGAARVILAVRDPAKGAAAKKSIEHSVPSLPAGVVQVWPLDLASYDSVAAFGARVDAELDRLDVVVANAGILPYDSTQAGEDEATMTVNVVNTIHHAVLMLPKLRETAARLGRETVLTFTGSWTHGLVDVDGLKGSKEGEVFPSLTRRAEKAAFLDRYAVSKLVQFLAVRELAARVTASGKPGSDRVTVSTVNPGGVKTDIDRGSTGMQRLVNRSGGWILRPTEVGGRTLVHGAQGGRATHGAYLDNCVVGVPYACVTSEAGAEAQRRIWDELVAKLARINPATVNVI